MVSNTMPPVKGATQSISSRSVHILFLSVLIICYLSFPLKQLMNTTTDTITTTSKIQVQYKLVDEVEGKYKRFAAYSNSDLLSIDDWIKLLDGNESSSHINNFVNVMKEASSAYKAFFFETKGTSPSNKSLKPFEFVIVNANSLHDSIKASGTDYNAFEEHFTNENTSLESTSVTFLNLGKDSVLIAPKPQPSNKPEVYTDLASFLRNASQEEITSLWYLVAKEYGKSLDGSNGQSQSVWLSTSGMGVSWLHVRIDKRPKYYTFRPFAQES